MAIKDTDLITVRNRNRGETGFVVDGNWTNFAINEVKKIPFGTLKSLTFIPGGQYTLDNYLVIENEEALDLLSMKVEPEYFYTEEEVKRLLLEGSIDEFADFLDFAPLGAIEIAKNIAVQEKVPDTRKRDMLSAKTGLNINNAIMVNEIMSEDAEPEVKEEKKRRVAVKEDKTPTRRTDAPATAPKYKVVSKG